MAYEQGDIKIFNPNQEISREITLEILIRHRDALKQARSGELVGIPINQIKDNDRKMYQAKALNLIISAQREMITASRPIIKHPSKFKWKKKYKEDKDQIEHPFEKEDNDYNKLIDLLEFLKSCEQDILKAEKSKRLEDDFLVTKTNGTTAEQVNELTENFYEMLEDLESSYEQIYLLMLINKIVSAGIEEDEEMSYKEKEAEAIRRIVGA
jgi:hypothetical protein